MRSKKADQGKAVAKINPERKRGRQPMTPEGKAAAAKVRDEQKAMADKLKPDVFLQYLEDETGIDTLIEVAKADFHKTRKRTLVTAMKVYIKPQERMAYYVINENFEGKVPF